MDYLSKFDFDITYIKGEYNKVADCLSRYYESDTRTDVHDVHHYVRADARIDPTGEDLPAERYHKVRNNVVELRAMRETKHRRSNRLRELREDCDFEADLMWEGGQQHLDGRSDVATVNSGHAEVRDPNERDNDPPLGQVLFSRNLSITPITWEDAHFLGQI